MAYLHILSHADEQSVTLPVPSRVSVALTAVLPVERVKIPQVSRSAPVQQALRYSG